jgi:hypothetical protein
MSKTLLKAGGVYYIGEDTNGDDVIDKVPVKLYGVDSNGDPVEVQCDTDGYPLVKQYESIASTNINYRFGTLTGETTEILAEVTKECIIQDITFIREGTDGDDPHLSLELYDGTTFNIYRNALTNALTNVRMLPDRVDSSAIFEGNTENQIVKLVRSIKVRGFNVKVVNSDVTDYSCSCTVAWSEV